MELGNFQCQGGLRIWVIEKQGPAVLAVGAGGGGGLFGIFFSHLFFLPLSWRWSIQTEIQTEILSQRTIKP